MDVRVVATCAWLVSCATPPPAPPTLLTRATHGRSLAPPTPSDAQDGDHAIALSVSTAREQGRRIFVRFVQAFDTGDPDTLGALFGSAVRVGGRGNPSNAELIEKFAEIRASLPAAQGLSIACFDLDGAQIVPGALNRGVNPRERLATIVVHARASEARCVYTFKRLLEIDALPSLALVYTLGDAPRIVAIQ